ncbi:MAG: DsbA family protein [Candidatus Diapherotrites archaeon]
MDNIKLLSITLIVASLILAGTMLYVGNNLNTKLTGLAALSAQPQNTDQTQPQQQQPTQVQPTQPTQNNNGKITLKNSNPPTTGQANAKVTIIEFSDFQCPYCARFVTDTYPQIKQQYIDTGKAKLIFMQFPLSFHQYAQKAAEAAYCAFEQGKFWEYHDKLFANQSNLDVTSLKKYATDLKLDTAKFNSCLDTSKYASQVQSDLTEGTSLGVNGTPAFFVNGKLISGAQPFSVFQQAIDAALAS